MEDIEHRVALRPPGRDRDPASLHGRARSAILRCSPADITDDELRDRGDAGRTQQGADAVHELVSAATRRHAGDDRFWAFVDAIAVMRHATPADRDLAIELLTGDRRGTAPRPAGTRRGGRRRARR